MIAKLLIAVFLIKGFALAQVTNPVKLGADSAAGADASTWTSSSISPSDNATLFVVIAFRSSSDKSISSVTTTLSNVGTWTVIIGDRESVVSATGIMLAYAKVTGAPGTGTITVTASAALTRSVASWFEVTGAHLTTPILQADSSETIVASTTLSMTLGSVPASGSVTVGVISVRAPSGNVVTVGSGETEITDLTSGGTSPINIQIQYSAEQTHDWANLNVASGAAAMLFEIQQATSASRRRYVVVSE